MIATTLPCFVLILLFFLLEILPLQTRDDWAIIIIISSSSSSLTAAAAFSPFQSGHPVDLQCVAMRHLHLLHRLPCLDHQAALSRVPHIQSLFRGCDSHSGSHPSLAIPYPSKKKTKPYCHNTFSRVQDLCSIIVLHLFVAAAAQRDAKSPCLFFFSSFVGGGEGGG